jgi:protocatechuate 3,4-dioxygenase beta subunit
MAPLPPGEYAGEMERTGFLMRRATGFENNPNAIRLTAGEKKDVALTLIPGGSIGGRIFDSNGEPMESIQVQAEGGSSELRAVRTDDAGRYRISGLLPGKYRVRAAPEHLPMPPEHRTDGTQEVHYARTYFGGVMTAKAAARVTVSAGAETTGTDIRLVRTPIVRVSGTLIGFPKGEKGANFQLDNDDGQMNYSGVNKPDGTFDLWRVDPGKYRLSARIGGGRTELWSAPVEIIVADSNIDGLVLRAIAPADIPGHVTYEDDAAKPKENPTLVLQEVTSRAHSPQRETAEINDDGSFRLEKVAPGRYMVKPSWRTAYVKSMTLGPVRLDGRILDLSAGPGDASLTVVLASDVGEISGTVRDEKGPVPVFVVLVPETADGSDFQISIGPQGNYGFPGLAPGDYKLFALPQGENSGHNALARNLELFEDVMEHVSVGPGQKVTKDLKLKTEQ